MKPLNWKDLIARMQIVEDDGGAQPPPECWQCDGVGQIQEPYRNDIGMIQHRIVPCPECETGRNIAEQIDRARFQQSRLPKLYEQAALVDFELLPSQYRAGKQLAITGATVFALGSDQIVSSVRVAQLLDTTMREQDRSWQTPDWLQDKLNGFDDRRPGLVLYGETGLGKTHLAAAAFNEIRNRGTYALYARMSDIIAALVATWAKDSEKTTAEVLERYKQAPVLFIDDMNMVTKDDTLPRHIQEYATTIMRARTNAELPTIITTNWSKDQFNTMWGSWCAEVVLAGYHWFKMGGAKIRNTQDGWGDDL